MWVGIVTREAPEGQLQFFSNDRTAKITILRDTYTNVQYINGKDS